jgi:class 3 adenylate cyclase
MPENPSRKLAAILAADIVGYSVLMGADEPRTVRDLKGHQTVVLPMVAEHGGRVIDTAGDGILAEFASVVNALECAVAIQKRMAERNATVEPERRMQFRMGVNLGDVIYDEARIYGDGINIAARLEGIAEPGGVFISRQVYDQVDGKVALSFRKFGPQTLKNIVKPVEVFAVDDVGGLDKVLVLNQTTRRCRHARGEGRDLRRGVPGGFVALRPGRSVPEAALLEHCRGKLVAFKVPAALVVVDAVPKNANGKLDRDALAAVWQRQQRGA